MGGAQPTEHLIYDCEILEIQRKTMKHQIKTSEGTWPTTNRDLVAKYSHAFTRFIKSVDFCKLQLNILYNGSYSQIPGIFNLYTTLHFGRFI